LSRRMGLHINFFWLKRSIPVIISTLLMLTSLIVFTGCSGEEQERTEIRVLCAGSLMVPLNELEKAFEDLHPDIDIMTEGHGSIQVIRHVTELYEEADVMAVADHSLIPIMMYNQKIPETEESYADWYIEFATNTLGIAYTPTSRYADEIDANNWYQILARPDIKLGISDARLDACGYRALMLLSLAESFYHDGSIFQGVLDIFNPPLEVTEDGGITTINVPEILRPESDKIVLRGSSIRMLALLESGDIDYAFEYRSVAEQHQLNFLSLPPEINLGSGEHLGMYKQVKCKLDFHRFSSVQPEFIGQPIIYGITIPRNAPHPKVAQDYLKFLLGPEGQQIFNESQHPMIPPVADNPGNLPDDLKNMITGDTL
jgi:molybdate/tungstate transport system substrate-binding protein